MFRPFRPSLETLEKREVFSAGPLAESHTYGPEEPPRTIYGSRDTKQAWYFILPNGELFKSASFNVEGRPDSPPASQLIDNSPRLNLKAAPESHDAVFAELGMPTGNSNVANISAAKEMWNYIVVTFKAESIAGDGDESNLLASTYGRGVVA